MSEALDALRVAVEQFAAVRHREDCDKTPVVTQALVVFELMCFGDDEPSRTIFYAVPTDNWSLTGGLGLIEAARYQVRQDCLGITGDDDD